MSRARKENASLAVSRSLAFTIHHHQCKYKRIKTRPTRAMEEIAKGKHVFQAALQWSAVLLNRTKARIKPLFELNRTAASVASSNNGMPTFSTPSTQKKFLQNAGERKK